MGEDSGGDGPVHVKIHLEGRMEDKMDRKTQQQHEGEDHEDTEFPLTGRPVVRPPHRAGILS